MGGGAGMFMDDITCTCNYCQWSANALVCHGKEGDLAPAAYRILHPTPTASRTGQTQHERPGEAGGEGGSVVPEEAIHVLAEERPDVALRGDVVGGWGAVEVCQRRHEVRLQLVDGLCGLPFCTLLRPAGHS